MANSFIYNNKTYKVGDTINIDYKIKEENKERIQSFKGILIKIKGNSLANRMITVRKMTKFGIGVERIIPLSSPFIAKIDLVKKSTYRKSKISFLPALSDQEVKAKLYKTKTASRKKSKKTS